MNHYEFLSEDKQQRTDIPNGSINNLKKKKIFTYQKEYKFLFTNILVVNHYLKKIQSTNFCTKIKSNIWCTSIKKYFKKNFFNAKLEFFLPKLKKI